MCSADTDVCNFHVSFDASPDCKRIIPKIEHVDNFGRCTFDWLQDHIVFLRLIKLHDAEERASKFVLKRLFAQLTLERFPKIWSNLRAFIHDALTVEPLLKTCYVYCTHGTWTLTRPDQMVIRLVLTETYSASVDLGYFHIQAFVACYLRSCEVAWEEGTLSSSCAAVFHTLIKG